MFVLDTNVASELTRPTPERAVAAWFAQRNVEGLYLTAVSEAELRYGVMTMPTGRRRAMLEASLAWWLDVGFGGRILPFVSATAQAYAATCGRTGRVAARKTRNG